MTHRPDRLLPSTLTSRHPHPGCRSRRLAWRRLAPTALAALTALAAVAGALPARAQTFKDPALEALYLAGKSEELQRVAGARLAAQPDDAQAVLGLALGVLERDDPAARLAAIKRAEACIERQAKAAPCHYALGAVMGVQALSEGMFKMARSVGTVKDALMQAHTLEPEWYPARSALVEFYLALPAVMGGSSSRAAELARGALRPGQAKALEGRVALANKQHEEALQTLLALPADTEADVQRDARGWAVQAGLSLVNAGQAAKAQPYFERMTREQADTAGPFYGLARVRGELGAHEDALKLYEQAQALKGAGQWPLQYRIGMSHQQLGHKDDARAAYKRYIASGKGPDSLQADAKKRLGELGG